MKSSKKTSEDRALMNTIKELKDKVNKLEASNLNLTIEVAELRDTLYELGGDLPSIDERVKDINKSIQKQWSKIKNDK